MTLRKKVLVATGVLISMCCTTANADFIISEFTGDDIDMQFTFSDLLDGSVDIGVSITAGSEETGDITGVWLGIDDDLFDPVSILASAITITPDLFDVIIPAVINLGGGVNLNGGSGIYLDFDLDIALRQPNQQGGNIIVDSLLINIDTTGLMASYFNEAGARVQTSTGPEGSSKLIGGVVKVAEPGTLALLGIGLLGFGLARRKTA